MIGKIKGAFVRETEPQIAKYLASFDLASLYPSMMRAFNISPETKGPKRDDISVERLLTYGIPDDVDQNFTLCANGQTFRKDKRGFMPEILDFLYEERKKAKAKKFEYKQKYTETKDETDKELSVTWGHRDQVFKVLLNSFFGAVASKTFLFFDKDVGEAITLTGQYVSRKMGDEMVRYLNKPSNQKRLIQEFEKKYG